MEIYIDILFFINFISTYVMLDLTGKIIKNKPKHIIIASILGAMLSVGAFCFEFGLIFQILNAVTVPIAAFEYRGFEAVYEILMFLIIQTVTAAVFQLLSGLKNTETIAVRNGIFYFDIPIQKFIIIFISAYLIMCVGNYIIKRRKIYIRQEITIFYKDKYTTVTALYDSGNLLKEPITGRGVVICQWESVSAMFNNISYDEFVNKAKKFRLWIIPYRSLGKKSDTLFAFVSDKVEFENRSLEKVFVAVTKEKLSANNNYQALIGSTL